MRYAFYIVNTILFLSEHGSKRYLKIGRLQIMRLSCVFVPREGSELVMVISRTGSVICVGRRILL